MNVQSHIAQAIDTSPLNRGLKGHEWLASEGNIPIVFSNGDVALFDDENDKIYQVHVLFHSRGAKAKYHVKESFRQLFEEHGARMIFGMVPNFRPDVKLMARWCGMKSAGLRRTEFGLCELFILSRDMWKGR